MTHRLAPIVAPICLLGLGSVFAAAFSFATEHHSTSRLIGVAALLAASTLASHFPVPLAGPDSGGVSLSFVFGASAIVLFGWDAGVLVAFAAPVLIQFLEHRPPIRIAYNGSVFAVAAGAGGLLVSLIGGQGTDALTAKVAIAATTQYAINLVLISLVVAASSRRPFLGLIRASLRWTLVIFALMASAALMLVVLWQRSPLLSAALVGPLLAIALYQRSTNRALRAMRLALTDPLTGLGNHRHFHERLERELIEAARNESDFNLYLTRLATSLRQNGEAFRLGGDEFALLLPQYDECEAVAAAEAIIERIGHLPLDHVGSVTVSAGVATFPRQAPDRGELIRLADSALYWAKENGKNRVHVYRPDVVELAELKRLAMGPDRAARFRAAASLAKAVDLRDTYTGSHSARVAELAARLAARLGLDQEQIELSRLAGSLHDLGKADGPRAARARAPPADRLPDAGQPRDRSRRQVDPPSPRALGRHRVSGSSARGRDPARRPNHLRRRRLRRDDLGPRLPRPAEPGRRARRAPALRRDAIRPGGRLRPGRGARAGGVRGAGRSAGLVASRKRHTFGAIPSPTRAHFPARIALGRRSAVPLLRCGRARAGCCRACAAGAARAS